MIFAFKTHLHLWLALLAAIVTFLIVSVQIFWQFSKFIAEMYDLAQLGTQSARGGVRMGPATGWQFYIDVFGWGIGWTMFGGVLVMLGYVLFKRRLEGLILSVFPIGLFAVMGAQKLFTARYLLPAIPPLVALVAFGLVKLERHRLFLRQYQRVFWPLSLVVLLAQPLTNLIWFDYLLTLPNTQQLATDWFIKNFPEDTVVAKETYSILPNFAFINKHWPYKVINLDNSDPTRNSVQHYVSHKTQIIALSNFRFARVREDPVAEEMRLKQLAFLDEKATLIKEFSPYRRPGYEDWFYQDQLYGPAGETLQRISPGPLIKIFQLPYESQPYSLDIPDIPILTKANFGNKLMLLGYDLLTRRAEPGGSIPLTLYWQALSRMRKTYIVFNHLLNDQQQNWGGYDRWPQETANTVLWRPSEVVIDTFGIPVAADAPAGIYTIDIGLYDQADLQASPLPILMEGRQPVGQNSVTIGPVKIGGPPPGVVLSAQELEPDTLLSIELGETPTILLHGYDLTRKNDKLHLTLYWESLAQTPVDWSNFVHLRNEAGETIVQKDGPAGSGRYPTSLWDTGEIIADEIVLPVENLPGGVYHLFVGLYDLATGTRLSVPDNPANEILLQNLSF